MGTSNNIASYDDVRSAFDRALSAPAGVRITTDSVDAATHLRHRLYKFRFLDRKESKTLFVEGDTRHGSSIYDVLTVVLNGPVLEIRKGGRNALQIEDIES